MHDMQPKTTHSALRSYIQDSLLGGKIVTDQQELLLSGMIDSLGVMSLVAFLEQEFGISIPFEDVTLENFGTIETIADYVTSRQAGSE